MEGSSHERYHEHYTSAEMTELSSMIVIGSNLEADSEGRARECQDRLAGAVKGDTCSHYDGQPEAYSSGRPLKRTKAFEESWVQHGRHNPYHQSSRSWRAWFPWTAVLGFVSSIACCGLMVIILTRSNNDSITNWSVQPSVYLAVLVVASNMSLRHAFGRATAIQWWIDATQPGQTAKSMHEKWCHMDSLLSAVSFGKSFGMLNLASIVITLLPATSPLLQKASFVGTTNRTANTTLAIPIIMELPQGYTGFVSGRDHSPAGLSPDFVEIANQYSQKSHVNVTNSGCTGACQGNVLGAGMTADCNSSYWHYELSTEVFPNGTVNATQPDGVPIFSVDFEAEALDIGFISLSLLWKDTGEENNYDSCDYMLQARDCVLKPALLQYSVLLQGDTISLDPNTSYKDDKVISTHQLPGDPYTDAGTYAGLYLTLLSLFNSSATMYNGYTIGMFLEMQGIPAYVYAIDPSAVACNLTWHDPTDDLLEAVRTIMFQTALRAGAQNSSSIQHVSSIDNMSVVVYRSNYLFLGLTILLTSLTMVIVALMGSHWQKLGRKVTLSPVETAQLVHPAVYKELTQAASIDTVLALGGWVPVRRDHMWY